MSSEARSRDFGRRKSTSGSVLSRVATWMVPAVALAVVLVAIVPVASANNFFPPYTAAFYGTSVSSTSGVGSNSQSVTPTASATNGIMKVDQTSSATAAGAATQTTYEGLYGPSGALLTTKTLTVVYNFSITYNAGLTTSICNGFGVSAADLTISFVANMHDLSTNTWVLSTNAQTVVLTQSWGCGISYTWSGTSATYKITFPATLFAGVTYEFWSEMVVTTDASAAGIASASSFVNVGSGGDYSVLTNCGTY